MGRAVRGAYGLFADWSLFQGGNGAGSEISLRWMPSDRPRKRANIGRPPEHWRTQAAMKTSKGADEDGSGEVRKAPER